MIKSTSNSASAKSIYPRLVVGNVSGSIVMQLDESRGVIVGLSDSKSFGNVGKSLKSMDKNDKNGNRWKPYYGTVELTNGYT